ncbi:M14 metallopeptidase family protein [Gemmatimonadota bacterium]
MPVQRSRTLIFIPTLLLILTATLPFHGAQAQNGITTPLEQFGHQLGDDYFLASYRQLQEYWAVLAAESDRMVLETIGQSEEGRPQLMAIITSPGNHASLDRYREISRSLAKAEGISEAQARALAAEGKAVVWIDGGLHASEILGAQQLMELVYRMVSRDDPETMRILDDVVLLAVQCNPDGQDLLADWYMRNPVPEQRSTGGLPVLYHKYAGHDNNRDSFMSNLIETENMNRILYRIWNPQIVYNHHQTGPSGTILFAPPYRDPPNHNLDPLIITSIEQVGVAMHGRFVQEGKGGSTMRSGASYSIWWNGGQRTTPYFHNMIGILTEMNGNPTPMQIPYLPDRQISSNDLPLPVEPGIWHFRQAIEYSMTADMAILDYASRNRDHLLFNIWRMGMSSIERGSRDNWTVLPKWIDAENEVGGRNRDRAAWEAALHVPANRDARGYILPSNQGDFPTAVKFVNVLMKNGIDAHRATRDFSVNGKQYPAGSLVIKAAQAFRPHILDMFEPQNHPNDFAYPGAPPTPPYDNAGWTLAFQMGVEFDQVLDEFNGPFEKIDWLAEVPAGEVHGSTEPAAFLMSSRVNNATIALNRLLKAGYSVYWITEPIEIAAVTDESTFAEGSFYIPAQRGVQAMINELAAELGLEFAALEEPGSGRALNLRPVRIGLWDRYGGSMPSGWLRFILEEFEFDYRLVFPQELDAGDLNKSFDVLIFPDGSIPGGTGVGGRGSGRSGSSNTTIPEEYQNRVGSVTVDATIPQIREFLEKGGTVIAEGSATNLGYHLGLPIQNQLVMTTEEGTERPLGSQQYYVPGSILEVKLEHTSPLTYGMGDRVDVFFNRSPVFKLGVNAEQQGVHRIGWFDSPTPLRSGWAWGQEYLENGTVLIEAEVGAGKLFLYGPGVTFRAQPHGTFPLVFNAIYYGTAQERRIR